MKTLSNVLGVPHAQGVGRNAAESVRRKSEICPDVDVRVFSGLLGDACVGDCDAQAEWHEGLIQQLERAYVVQASHWALSKVLLARDTIQK